MKSRPCLVRSVDNIGKHCSRATGAPTGPRLSITGRYIRGIYCCGRRENTPAILSLSSLPCTRMGGDQLCGYRVRNRRRPNIVGKQRQSPGGDRPSFRNDPVTHDDEAITHTSGKEEKRGKRESWVAFETRQYTTCMCTYMHRFTWLDI